LAVIFAEGDGHIDLAQDRLLRRLFIGRAAGTAIGFALGEDRDRGIAFEFPQEIVGDRLEKFAFDGALAPASSSQSLEIRIVSSVDGGTDNACRRRHDLCPGSNT
jgi:hypothetical protein